MRVIDPRERLVALSKQFRTGMAELSLMIGRPRGYLGRYVNRRVDDLSDADRETLCAFFGVSVMELGGPDPRAAKFAVRK